MLEMLEYVRKIIQKHYGNGRIENIEYLSAGRINNIFKVTLKDCKDDAVVIRLRYFHDPNFGQRFGTEHMINDILHGCIQYPQVIEMDDSKELVPCEYSILTFADGRHFNTEYDSTEQFEELGKIVKKIHTAYVPQKYKMQFMTSGDIDQYYKKRFTGIIEDAKKYDPHMYELIKDSMKYYYSNVYTPENISLTHHDLHEKNVIVNGRDMTLLDWESARVEATEVEFIRAKYYLLNRSTKSKVDAFIEGYGDTHFSDNFFMQELMWLARISNFERIFPCKKEEEEYWCSADYLSECLEELLSKYKGRGSYTTIDEIVTPQKQSVRRFKTIEIAR